MRLASRPLVFALLTAGVAGAMLGCHGEDCTMNTVPALGGEARDGVSGEVVCDAQFHVTAPNFDQVFECAPDAGPAGLPCCGFGTNGPADVEYTIEVTAPNHLPVTKKVFVPQNECGQPVTQHVTIEMQPL